MCNSDVVFGIRTPRYDTPHYLELQRVVTEMSGLGEIGASPPVDWFPVLKYVPERFWGNWRTRAAKLRKRILDLHAPLVDRVIDRRKNEIGHPGSFIDGVLDQQDKLGLTRPEIQIMCGNLLEGGTDTMATTLLVFCQAMATHPHVQDEAQREMDAALSDTELPSWSHRDKLPYVAMITKELLRWRPPAPGSFPHALAKGAHPIWQPMAASALSSFPLTIKGKLPPSSHCPRLRDRRHQIPQSHRVDHQHLGHPPRRKSLRQPVSLQSQPLRPPTPTRLGLRQLPGQQQARPLRLRHRPAYLPGDPSCRTLSLHCCCKDDLGPYDPAPEG